MPRRSPAESFRFANVDVVPAGKYGKAALQKLGAWNGVKDKIAQAENVRAALLLVARGEAPLGIVYSTDATTGFKLVVPLPLLDQPPIEYVVAQARDPQSDTRPFMTFVKSAAAKAAFKAAGLAPIDDARAAGGGND